MELNRAKSKASWKGKALGADEQHLIKFAKDYAATGKDVHFIGYKDITSSGKIAALSNGQSGVTQLEADETGVILLDQTSFYGESGGQAGDTGYLTSGTARAKVLNTTKIDNIILHHVEVESGIFTLSSEVTTFVDRIERRNKFLHDPIMQAFGCQNLYVRHPGQHPPDQLLTAGGLQPHFDSAICAHSKLLRGMPLPFGDVDHQFRLE
jgi:hypothetical protein